MTGGDSPGEAPEVGGRSALPLTWCLLAAALFGASTPASKVLLEELSPLVLSGLLYLGGALCVLPWAVRGVGALRAVDRRNVLNLLGAVFAGGVVGPVLLLTGLRMAPAGSVALWLNLESVATALLARAFFREHLHAHTWIAVALIVLASGLLSGDPAGRGVALVWVVAACFAWGLDNNFTANIDRCSPAQITFVKGLAAGVVNTAAGLSLASVPITVGEVTASLLVGAFAYGASILLYVRGAQQLGATRSQLVFSTAPAFGLALSWAALGERMTVPQLLAVALMGFAVWLWHRERHAHQHEHERLIHTHAHRHDDGHHDHEHVDGMQARQWHTHEHVHEPQRHQHPHQPDLHHRHRH